MKILLVAATALETAKIREKLGIEMNQDALSAPVRFGPYAITLLHTGIGMVNAAYQLGRCLPQVKPDIAVNFGIAGSFDPKRSLGDLVEITQDTFSELGAEDGDQFLDLEDMGFPLMNHLTNQTYNTLNNPFASPFALPKVKGITVNTVHGHAASIGRVQERWEADVETMEGAAFFHALLHEKDIPFYAIRSISNYVEPRDKSKWDIPKSVAAAQDFVLKQLTQFVL